MKHELEKREKITRRDLRRDPAVRADLARELGVEEAPESFGRAMRSAYGELPEELPVKRYPLRSAVRGLGAAAAALLLACGSLLGLNLANPQLAESLPGLGTVFQRLNGTEPKLPEDQGTVPVVEVSGSPAPQKAALPKAPEFQPVVLPGREELGEALTVSNAKSDGLYLSFSLRLETEDPDLLNCVWISPQFLEQQALTLKVNGGDALAAVCLEQQEDGSFASDWTVELPEAAKGQKALSVELRISELYGCETLRGITEEKVYAGFWENDQPDHTCRPGISGAFTVTVEPALHRSFPVDGGPVVDNEVQLLGVEQTLGYVDVELEVPFLGRMSYDLDTDVQRVLHEAPFFQELGGAIYSRPVGLSPYLHTEDGAVLQRQDGDEEYDLGIEFPEKGKDPAKLEDGPTRHTWRFAPPPEGTEKLVLTLYEYDCDGDLTGMEQGTVKNPVLAEFTIDLAAGTLEASENYVSQGVEKLDAEACRNKVRHGEFTNGYYAMRTYLWCTDDPQCASRYAHHVVLYGEDTAYRPVELRCYLNGELYATLPACAPEDYNAEQYGKGYSQTAQGQYWGGVSDPAYTQKEFRELVFNVYYPEWVSRDEWGAPAGRLTMNLVDSETGQVLVEDVERTYWRQMGLEDVYYSGSEGVQPDVRRTEEQARAGEETGVESWPPPQPEPPPTPEPAPDLPSEPHSPSTPDSTPYPTPYSLPTPNPQ